MSTEIQWTDETWNPSTGCTKVSPGCANCYIERTMPFRKGHNHFVNGKTRLELHPSRLVKPLSWKAPRRVFVNSLSDLFHEDVPFDFIDQVFAVMALSPQHTFQVLTKRAKRMAEYLDYTGPDTIDLASEGFGACHANFDNRWPLPNVWLGVSVENQHFADERIPLLLQMPAAVRFISAEPLLGPLDLAGFIPNSQPWKPYVECRHGYDACPICDGNPNPALDWVIVGFESGPKARPGETAWARSVLRQCKGAGIAAFMKQLGRRIIERNDAGFEGDTMSSWPMDTMYGEDVRDGYQGAPVRIRLRDRSGGDPAEWPEDLRVREFPSMVAAR